MNFLSLAFWALVFSVVAGMWILPSRASRQVLILLASLVFYGYFNPLYLLLLLAPSLIDYICALRIDRSSVPRVRRAWVVLSVTSNLGLLGYFKYANFFLSSAATISGKPFHALDIILPAGISFYTFKTLSYTIDVYRREIPVCRSWWRYAMFVTYFPELIAGPIVRASVFLPQLERSLEGSWPRINQGLQIVLLGLTKKILIADNLAPFADSVFAAPAAFNGLTVALGVLSYSLQIYCDFSGYSDMAIGVSRMIGFDLPENFDMPYLSTSITEFWRRWHITLSRWLRDYLYIPLGGNRKGRVRTYVNLTITMLLGGLWHGANWTFVMWGLLHGLGLAIHKLLRERAGGLSRIPVWLGWLATNSFVALCWVLFRSRDFTTALTVYRKIFGLAPGGVEWLALPLFLSLPLVIVGHGVGWLAARTAKTEGSRDAAPAPGVLAPIYERAGRPFAIKPHPSSGWYVLMPNPGFAGSFATTMWLLLLLAFGATHTSPFIYFRF